MSNIALILSGAVSLGSFEAGVLTELLFVLDHLDRRGRRRYTLDVITGASAGAMTAALVARAVMPPLQPARMIPVPMPRTSPDSGGRYETTEMLVEVHRRAGPLGELVEQAQMPDNRTGYLAFA